MSCWSYGYGWELYAQQDRAGGTDAVIEHYGSINGFRAVSRYYPDLQLHLIVLLNSEHLGPGYVARTIWDAAVIG